MARKERLTEEQLQRFDEIGYLVLNNVFSDPDL